jgi:hypothetical protein
MIVQVFSHPMKSAFNRPNVGLPVLNHFLKTHCVKRYTRPKQAWSTHSKRVVRGISLHRDLVPKQVFNRLDLEILGVIHFGDASACQCDQLLIIFLVKVLEQHVMFQALLRSLALDKEHDSFVQGHGVGRHFWLETLKDQLLW